MPTLPVPPIELAVALVLAAIGAALQGSVGLGLAVVAAPILLLFNPLWVPGPMLLAAMLLVTLIAHRDRAHIIAGDVALATTGRILGTMPAAYAMNLLPSGIYDLVFGVIVLSGVLLSVSGWHVEADAAERGLFRHILRRRQHDLVGRRSADGADLPARSRPERPRHDVGDLHPRHDHFDQPACGGPATSAMTQLMMGLSLMPGILVGFACSRYTAAWLDRRHTRPAILTVSAVSALVILVRAIYNLM